MEGNYLVKIEPFAERHFIKFFQKKYKTAWDVTLRAIFAEFERIDSLLLTDRAEVISEIDDVRIIKTKFKIAGTQESAKTSGNRCIVAVNQSSQSVSVLFVYGKTDLGGGKETMEWKNIIKENYPELRNFFS
jgi:hypothetical protein